MLFFSALINWLNHLFFSKHNDIFNDKLFLNYFSTIQIQVYGEQENCTYEEKMYVQVVAWSRLMEKHIKFNPIEKDFKGYNRKMYITNEIEKQQFKDQIDQTFEQYVKLKRGEIERMHFFNLKTSGTLPSTVYAIKEVEVPNYFKHRFFKILF